VLRVFTKGLPRGLLDIEDKRRSNLFAWRGQFSPQLIESLLEAYCPDGAVVLDPFAGSGTVLHEAARLSMAAYAFEVNPAAWAFSKTYEFANLSADERETAIAELRSHLEAHFPIVLFSAEALSLAEVESKVMEIGPQLSNHAKVLLNALVILLDLANNRLTIELVQSRFLALAEMVRNLPYSRQPVKADLQDARALPLEDGTVGFVVTSPPYINVFNYHQNYRRSAEALGWDLLRVARSEIGSNRANRGNRFHTVVQYCVDMAAVLAELSRILEDDGRVVLVVGHESRVLRVPFYNAQIMAQIAERSGAFSLVLRQERIFTNRFGMAIREDILNMVKSPRRSAADLAQVARSVARGALEAGRRLATGKNSALLSDAIERSGDIQGTPIFNSRTYRHYQTREEVMMVNEQERQA